MVMEEVLVWMVLFWIMRRGMAFVHRIEK